MKRLSLILLGLCTSWLALANPTAIYGHRGARGLAPENTLAAYKTALRIGVDYVDMDIGMTKDGVLVVTHNLTLNPDITRDAKGHWITSPNLKIKDLTLKQIETYNVGKIKPGTAYAKLFRNQHAEAIARIPTLVSVINYVKKIAGDKVGFQIEIKTDPTQPNATFPPVKIATRLAQVLKQEGVVDRTQVQSFDLRPLLVLERINPAIQTAYLTEKGNLKEMRSRDKAYAGLWTAGLLVRNYGNSVLALLHKNHIDLWDPEDSQLNQALITKAHKLGMKIVVWTWPSVTGKVVDTPELSRFIRWHVDGIITGRPDILRGLLAAQGENVAPGFNIPNQVVG